MKKILLVITSILAILMGIIVAKSILKIDNNDKERISKENTQELPDSKYVETNECDVIDECLNENGGDDDDSSQAVSYDIDDENTRFLIKSADGIILVYYLDEDNEEYLYSTTDISTEYLSAQDEDDLEIGIEIKGIYELNRILENFE